MKLEGEELEEVMKKIVVLMLIVVLGISTICFAAEELEDMSDSITLDDYEDFYSAYTDRKSVV